MSEPKIELPPLPLAYEHECESFEGTYYSDDQMEEYARAAILAERERCARVCDGVRHRHLTRLELECAAGSANCAAAIRGIHPQDVGAQMAQLQAAAIRRG